MARRQAATKVDRKTKAIAFGIVLVAVGLFLIWGGLTPLSQERDADGYLLSDPLTIDRPSYAVTTNDVDLLRGHYDCAAEETLILDFFSPDDVRMRGVAAGTGGIFIGIAPADAVESYLAGVAYDEITDWDCDVADIKPVDYTRREGAAVPNAPSAGEFWVAAVSGSGEQTLDWRIESGEWTVVVMNDDASSGVAADVRFGAQAPSSLDALAWILFAVGLLALAGGGCLLYLGFRRWGRTPTPAFDNAATTPENEAPPEPACSER